MAMPAGMPMEHAPHQGLATIEAMAIRAQEAGRWQMAANLWRRACGGWSREGDRARAAYALTRAGRCELQLDPEYAELLRQGLVIRG